MAQERINAARSTGTRGLLLGTVALLLLNLALLLPRRDKAAAAARPGALRIGLVFDVGGRGDKSFNDAAYLGVARAARELPVTVEYIEPGEGSDRESGLRLLAARGFDLVIGVGFIFSDDLYAMALEYPRLRFANIDYAKFDQNGFVQPPPNLIALKFREEEGSFLVGAIAGLRTRGNAVGFVGGMDMPLIRKFEAGYRAGVLAVCPACRVLSGYAGVSGDAFKNPGRGKELALAQYGAGADIIFHAAGTTGFGVFEAARAQHRLAIGVDADQWAEAPGFLLTSMIKRIDVAVFQTIAELCAGRFHGGVQVFGLAEGGIDYAYDEPARGMIPTDVRARVEALRQEIIRGARRVPTAL